MRPLMGAPPQRGRRTLMLLLALLLRVPAASGEPRLRSAALAPLSALGIAPDEAAAVDERLRAAAVALPDLQWAQHPRLLRRLRATPAQCFEEPACASALARRAGLDWLVSGEVGSTGAAYVVYLRAHSAREQAPRHVRALLPSPSTSAGATVAGGAEEALLVRLLLPQQYVGSLVIRVDTPGAWIYLDGRRVARGPLATLDRVAVGTHTLRIAHQAHHDDLRFVQVAYAQRQTLAVRLRPLSLALSASTAAAAATALGRDVRWPWYRRWWAVAAFGVLVAATATTTVLLLPHDVARDREATVGLP